MHVRRLKKYSTGKSWSRRRKEIRLALVWYFRAGAVLQKYGERRTIKNSALAGSINTYYAYALIVYDTQSKSEGEDMPWWLEQEKGGFIPPMELLSPLSASDGKAGCLFRIEWQFRCDSKTWARNYWYLSGRLQEKKYSGPLHVNWRHLWWKKYQALPGHPNLKKWDRDMIHKVSSIVFVLHDTSL